MLSAGILKHFNQKLESVLLTAFNCIYRFLQAKLYIFPLNEEIVAISPVATEKHALFCFFVHFHFMNRLNDMQMLK